MRANARCGRPDRRGRLRRRCARRRAARPPARARLHGRGRLFDALGARHRAGGPVRRARRVARAAQRARQERQACAMSFAAPVTLRGQHASLEPLRAEHAPALAEAVRDGELWKLWYTTIPRPDGMAAEIERRLDLQAKGSMLPFAVLDAAGIRGGHDHLHEHRCRPPARRDRIHLVRSACAAHAAEHRMQADAAHARVRERCSASRSSSARIASTPRAAARSSGSARSSTACCARINARATARLRDTAVYSITGAEWPTVKTHLQWQLRRAR